MLYEKQAQKRQDEAVGSQVQQSSIFICNEGNIMIISPLHSMMERCGV